MPDRVLEHTAAADTPGLLIETVRRLAGELRPGGAISVTLDSDLERDLGLDSLARVELLLRIERDFRVHLTEDLFVSVRTPRDLLAAVARVAPRDAAGVATVPELPDAEDGTEPAAAEDLVAVLEWHCARYPDRTHVLFHGTDGTETTLSYGALREKSRAVANELRVHALQTGEPVAIMLPTGAGFLCSFYGVLLAGGVPVPLYPPARLAGLEDHLTRQAAILNNARAAILITVPEAKPFAAMLKARAPGLRRVLTEPELHGEAGVFSHPRITAQDLALLQYTSGSTGSPKGVMLSHANLLANIRAMGRAIAVDKEDVFVSWLPLYHDMGLIGAWLGCLYYALPLVLMSPLTFLVRPAAWLWALHRFKGTLSGGPNFAYALCTHKVRDEDIRGLDLSRWRFAFNGAEPINAQTLADFSRRFSAHGFHEWAMTPVYGLAECSVGLAFPERRGRPRVDRVKRESFEHGGRAEPTQPAEAGAVVFVACGSALPGHHIRIVDDHDRELGERLQGRLQFKGPSATRGYYRNEEESRRLLHGEWRDSGDLAYLADGLLYITGRAKEIIIRAGRNIHPYELEEAVGKLPQVRKGCVAAFGVAGRQEGTEGLVIVAETRERAAESRERLRRQINAVVADIIGNPPDDVVLATPRAVLKTSSGKIRRAENRLVYEHGGFTRARPAWLRWIPLLLSAVWRQIRAGCAAVMHKAYGVYAVAVFTPCAAITWAAVLVLPRHRWRTGVIRIMGRIAAVLARIRLRTEGMERLAKRTPCIIVANHASYLDGLALSFALPLRPGYVVKRELADHWLTRVFLQRIGCEFVERNDARRGVEDTRRLQAVAGKGKSLVFFPEGTFDRTPGLRPFRMGAFLVAVEAGVPVVPLTITGTRRILPAGAWLPRRGAITLHCGEPVLPDGNDWAAAVKLRDATRGQILRCCGEGDLI